MPELHHIRPVYLLGAPRVPCCGRLGTFPSSFQSSFLLPSSRQCGASNCRRDHYTNTDPMILRRKSRPNPPGGGILRPGGQLWMECRHTNLGRGNPESIALHNTTPLDLPFSEARGRGIGRVCRVGCSVLCSVLCAAFVHFSFSRCLSSSSDSFSSDLIKSDCQGTLAFGTLQPYTHHLLHRVLAPTNPPFATWRNSSFSVLRAGPFPGPLDLEKANGCHSGARLDFLKNLLRATSALHT